MRQHVFRLVAGDGEHQLAFIGEVQGVQTKQLADAAHRVVDRQRCLLQFDAAAAGGGELMGDRVNPAAGGVAQGFHSAQRAQGLDKRRQHRAVRWTARRPAPSARAG